MSLLQVTFLSLISVSVIYCRSPASSTNCTNWEDSINLYGAQVFLLGDRSFVIPRTISEMESVTCPRLLDAGDKLKDIVKSCLRPFPKTIAGLLIRGSRRVMRAKCNDQKEKEFIIRHLSCIRPLNRIDQLHDVIDMYNRKLIYIRDTVPVASKLDLTCCHYFAAKKEMIAVARKFCPQIAVDYAIGIVDDMMKESLEVSCGPYLSDESKCAPVITKTPVPVTMNSKKETDAFLLPLINVLTAVGDE